MAEYDGFTYLAAEVLGKNVETLCHFFLLFLFDGAKLRQFCFSGK